MSLLPVRFPIRSEPNGRDRETLEGHSSWNAALPLAEVRRRICHAFPGVIALLLALIPHPRPLRPLDVLAISIGIVLLAIIVRRTYSLIARPGEHERTLNVVKYCSAVIAMLILFPDHLEFALVVVTVVAFGDGSATLIGILFGRHRLPWNPRKSWEGFLAFICCSLPAATFAYWLETQPAIPVRSALICAASAAICGQIAETLPMKSSDNLRVGIAAAIGVAAAHFMRCNS